MTDTSQDETYVSPYKNFKPLVIPYDQIYFDYDPLKLKKELNLTTAQAFRLPSMINFYRGHLVDAMIHTRTWKKIEQPTLEQVYEFLKESPPLKSRLEYKFQRYDHRIMTNLAKKGIIDIDHIDYQKDAPYLIPHLKNKKELKKGYDVWIPKWKGFDEKIEELC